MCLSANLHHYQCEFPSFLKEEGFKGCKKGGKGSCLPYWCRERPKTSLLYLRDTQSQKDGVNARTGIRLCQGSNGRSRFSVSWLLPSVMDWEVNNRYVLGSSVRSILCSHFSDLL
ncbi:hypothetical protein AMECASPLE_008120 [Ameca splendens]|uniref:Uncharacterized protein n=1 Tax=Ameca splendens TaxID=208324 RepID=A0ABV0XZR8_9TELE